MKRPREKGYEECQNGLEEVSEVAVTGTVGAGIDFSEKHFDVTFSIIGCSSSVECQFQLIHRVIHTNNNLLYLWIDKLGKQGIPTKKQIYKELDRKHRDGQKMSAALLSMPLWLKDLYVSELQNIYRTTRTFHSNKS